MHKAKGWNSQKVGAVTEYWDDGRALAYGKMDNEWHVLWSKDGEIIGMKKFSTKKETENFVKNKLDKKSWKGKPVILGIRAR